jgi:integrase
MVGRLTARKVETAKRGKYSDGGNLYLIVAPTGSRKWVFRFTWRGKAKEMGLGSATKVPLKLARERAAAALRKLGEGLNPIEDRNTSLHIPTFGQMAEIVHNSLSIGFRNEAHSRQWKSSLTVFADRLLAKPVDKIGTEEILGVLEGIWTAKPETASRVRGRIEKVLDAAKARSFRQGENPARWRGHLDHLLPRPSKLARVHHAAMAYEGVPTFLNELRKQATIPAYALEFCILTASRSGEVLNAAWPEIDPNKKLWTIPAHRMKAGREHRVPLCERAMVILGHMIEFRLSEFLFPGQASRRPLSNSTLRMLLVNLDIKDATVHGFRSSFRDWAGNTTEFPREVAEAALAHIIGNQVEQAYRRRDAIDKRRQLMNAWASYCEGSEPGRVDPASGSGVSALPIVGFAGNPEADGTSRVI